MNESARYDFIVLAAGLLVVLGGLITLRTGKTLQGRHFWDDPEDRDGAREHSPIQFWVHVALYFAIGGALVAYGANQLLTR
jgi:hypothetical protein